MERVAGVIDYTIFWKDKGSSKCLGRRRKRSARHTQALSGGADGNNE